MAPEPDLAAIGRNIKRSRLLQQAKIDAHKARAAFVELCQFGWSQQRSDLLDQQIASLETLLAKQATLKEDIRVASDELAIAKSEAGTFISRLRLALRPVLRTLPHGDSTAMMFKTNGARSNAASMSEYFARIRPGVEKLSSQLQPMLPGAPPVQQLDTLKANLDAACTAAAVVRSKQPALTNSLNNTAGEIVMSLRDLVTFATLALGKIPEDKAPIFVDLIDGRKDRPSDTTVTKVVSDPVPAQPPSTATTALAAPTATTALVAPVSSGSEDGAHT